MELTIDFHNHFYPEGYVKYLAKRTNSPKVVTNESGVPQLVHEGFSATLTDAFLDVEARRRDMEKHGVDQQVLTPGNPWADVFTPEESVTVARIINDEIAKTVEKDPDHFVGFGALPFRNPPAAVEELERAITQLGLKGIITGTNIAQTPLSAPEFFPIYEKAAKLGAPIFIHPTTPAALDAMREYSLTILLGYVSDTSLSVCKLIFSGVLEKLPNLKLVAAHLGGTLPYLAGRVDKGYEIDPACRENIRKPPSEYMKALYADTVIYNEWALMCGYTFWGSDRLMFGSDYPFSICDVAGNIKIIRKIGIPEEDKAKLLAQTAQKLLKI